MITLLFAGLAGLFVGGLTAFTLALLIGLSSGCPYCTRVLDIDSKSD